MPINTVIHKITKDYRVIEYQVIENDKVVDTYFKVSFSDGNEFKQNFAELSDAIDYINDLTFK